LVGFAPGRGLEHGDANRPKTEKIPGPKPAGAMRDAFAGSAKAGQFLGVKPKEQQRRSNKWCIISVLTA
jgi:hypothetical protein